MSSKVNLTSVFLREVKDFVIPISPEEFVCLFYKNITIL